ncbi:hypothetical protein pb186bvf_019080 [Paramecium bursaria]
MQLDNEAQSITQTIFYLLDYSLNFQDPLINQIFLFSFYKYVCISIISIFQYLNIADQIVQNHQSITVVKQRVLIYKDLDLRLDYESLQIVINIF